VRESLINFTLVPLAHVQPWGSPGKHNLHWFGLTDGEYWLQVGDTALFEYSESARADGAKRYCDYQVVRLYEDLLDMLPDVLEPVPLALTRYLPLAEASAWRTRCAEWVEAYEDTPGDDHCSDMFEYATDWLGKRMLDSAYLSPSANIAIWSDAHDVHIAWDHTGVEYQGQPVWTATRGAFTLPRALHRRGGVFSRASHGANGIADRAGSKRRTRTKYRY
jgi:hypothetical protein